MIVKNTSNSELDVVIKGAHYHVEPLGEISNVTEEHATHWKTLIHEFIIVLPEAKVAVVEQPEPPKVEPEVTAPAEEKTVEAPKVVETTKASTKVATKTK